MSNPQYKHGIKQSAVLLWLHQPHGSCEGPERCGQDMSPIEGAINQEPPPFATVPNVERGKLTLLP